MTYSTKSFFIVASLVLLLSCGGKSTNSNTVRQSANAVEQQGNTTSSSATNPHTSQQDLLTGQEPAKSIPDFTFYVLKSGISFEKSNMGTGDKQVFILFDPSCSFCQHEAADISKNFDKLKNINFYFISMNDPALMSTFFDRFAPNLNGKDNVQMLYDRNIDFVNKFHVPTQYPATYIYDGQGLLLTYWNGVKSENEMLNALLN
ncbi:MAG TPA: redoxin domain-containing protein [Sphingobacteriaceae bacterium]|nr:redoxin domain-containing protein [Sphingobacteriaceae bacterium]